MVSWATVRSLLFTFGPILLPRAISLYRSLRSTNPALIRPCPPAVRRALNILFITTLVYLLSSILFIPPNLFRETNTRPQADIGVILSRLARIRPLTPTDDALRTKLLSQESKLLYIKYGPDILAECPFCSSENPMTYFYYALPRLLLVHLVHLTILGFVTSSIFSGGEGRRLRTAATIAGVGLALADVIIVNSFDHKVNARALHIGQVDFFYWRMKTYRGIALAACDAIFGLVLWATATNRLLPQPPSLAEQLEAMKRYQESALSKYQALGIIRNSIYRDAGLRADVNAYWVEEGERTATAMEDEEVVKATSSALGSRISIDKITDEVTRYTDEMFTGLNGSTGR